MAMLSTLHLFTNGPIESPKVGDPATMLLYSDSHAGTVVYVSPSGKTIRVQKDRAALVAGNTRSERQEYTYERNPDGPITTYRKTTRGWSNRNAAASRCLVGVRREWRDPSF